MIFFLAKFFAQPEHASDFLNGKMYINRLSYFKKIEGYDGRGDEYEGAIIPQLNELTIMLRIENSDTGELERCTIREEDLAEPPILVPERFDDINVYCMYASHSGEIETIADHDLSELSRRLEIPDENSKLGEHAVMILDNPEFLRRVKTACNRERYRICRGLVRYYDPTVGMPPLKSNIETIFTKREDYGYQSEYRIAIDTGTEGSNAVVLDIGKINDIAVLTHTCDISKRVSLKHHSTTALKESLALQKINTDLP